MSSVWCQRDPVTPRSRSARERLSVSRSDALRAGLGELGHTASTGSTNDDLVAEARCGDRLPAILVADHRTAGKRRLGCRWSAAAPPPAADGAAHRRGAAWR